MDDKKTPSEPIDFDGSFRSELRTLRKKFEHDDIKNTVSAAHKARLSGLAFSGGGIRSATFNLGVVQGLAHLGMLDKFDYLSTVSGGGYIGSWLTAWIRREFASRGNAETSPGQSGMEGMTARAFNLFAYQTETYAKYPLGPLLAEKEAKTETVAADDEQAPEDRSGFDRVAAALRGGKEKKNGANDGGGPPGDDYEEPRPISFLREFSNYLTPRRGWWGNDTWTLAVSYIRNFVLTFSVLLGALIAGVLVVHSLGLLYYHTIDPGGFFRAWGNYIISLVFLSASAFLCSWDMASCLFPPQESGNAKEGAAETKAGAAAADEEKAKTADGRESGSLKITRMAVVTILISVWFGAAGLWQVRSDLAEGIFSHKTTTLVVFAVTLASVFIAGVLGRSACRRQNPMETAGQILKNARLDAQGHGKRGLAALAGGVGMIMTLYLLSLLIGPISDGTGTLGSGSWLFVVYGPLSVLLAYCVFAAIFVGATENTLHELEREWLSRMFAAVTKWTLLLCALTALVLYTPMAAAWLNSKLSGASNGVLGLLWAGISSAGAILARSGGNGASSKTRRWISRAVTAVAPLVFMVGLICITTWGLHHWSPKVLKEALTLSQAPPSRFDFWLCLLTGIGVLGVAAFWSYCVGVNTFSLHALYGNRLVRAYLGASNLQRRAHPFIGFDAGDNDVRLADLNPGEKGYKGPFLIVNAAINLVHGKRLAWQQRKAGSFTFTPLRCGYELASESVAGSGETQAPAGGYALSDEYAGKNGISLGKAMTISGAAASPNMGYHSSSGLAFLMTVFNVRLGWWLPNTGLGRSGLSLLRRRGPRLGLGYLIYELLGMTNARSNFVYVSDGGHFENLGIYELVRRRARFIVASDAAADPQMSFGDLGNAIERCRADFGISIDIDVNQLKRDSRTGRSPWHCAIGIVRYSEVDPMARDGVLLYVKASLTGDEPQDVTAYGTKNAGFPHQTTADQWFDETQFESYRTLGQHIIEEVMRIPVRVAEERSYLKDERGQRGTDPSTDPVRAAEERSDLRDERDQRQTDPPTERKDRKDKMERIFEELKKMWHPPIKAKASSPADLDATLVDIIDTMRTDPALTFLDWQLYPDVGRTVRDAEIKIRAIPWIPETYEELRAGFCFCKRLLLFMEQVCEDRQLDVAYSAAGNRGWMNLLRRWSHSKMLRYTWSMTAGTYSARFQTFCEHHLYMEVENLNWARPFAVQCIAGPSGKGDGDMKPLEAADRSYGIDYYENMVIGEFLDKYLEQNGGFPEEARFIVYPLTVHAEDPTTSRPEKFTRINAGFAIVGPGKVKETGKEKDMVLYIRIRPTMRRMGYLNQAVEKVTPEEIEHHRPPDGQALEKFYIRRADKRKRGLMRYNIQREIYMLRFNRPNHDWLEKLNLEMLQAQDAPERRTPEDAAGAGRPEEAIE